MSAHKVVVSLLLGLSACEVAGEEETSSTASHALAGEDGLAEAYQIFKNQFHEANQDNSFTMSFGPSEALVTTRVGLDGAPTTGSLNLDFENALVRATLAQVPAERQFDLWLVKNQPGGSVRPEKDDVMRLVGRFAPTTLRGFQSLEIAADASLLDFDFDLVVVSEAGGDPTTSVVATGARTLFEKRFFRERLGLASPAVTGALLTSVETTDPLVARGAQVFFHETFDGNGRTCGTCHPAENNLTIDPAFIATLPASDPLFIAEIDPNLARLENPLLLRHDALILENVDGFDNPTGKFVLRSVPHTLAMSTSMGRGDTFVFPTDGTPPDFRTGWSGDGAPGRGSLNEFGVGAVMQHFTRDLARRPGIDFRLPTQEELDALEAFQLFSGRQKNPQTASITFASPRAEAGKNFFINTCVACHRDVVAGSVNLMMDTDIERLLIAAPRDGGFGTVGTDTQGGIGVGRFNVPPLVEAADTGPFFHNNVIQTLEEAIAFYSSDVFFFSPGRNFSGPFAMTEQQIDEVSAYLRVINAAENIRQTKKRTSFVQASRGPGNDDILKVAIADLGDAIDVLEPRGLHPNAVHALKTARQTLVIARANPDAARPPFMASALVWLAIARSDLFLFNPLNEF